MDRWIAELAAILAVLAHLYDLHGVGAPGLAYRLADGHHDEVALRNTPFLTGRIRPPL